MSEILNIIDSFKVECSCGRKHTTAIRDIRIASGLVNQVGEILEENCFPKNLLLVADNNTLKAAEGITQSLTGYHIQYKVYDNLRVAEMRHVEEIENLVKDKDIAVLSVGTMTRAVLQLRGRISFCVFLLLHRQWTDLLHTVHQLWRTVLNSAIPQKAPKSLSVIQKFWHRHRPN